MILPIMSTKILERVDYTRKSDFLPAFSVNDNFRIKVYEFLQFKVTEPFEKNTPPRMKTKYNEQPK